MTAALELWRKRADAFGAVTARTTDWDAPTPCEKWAARDVVEHVVSTQQDFLSEHGLLRGGFTDGSTGPGNPTDPANPRTLWPTHERMVAALLADPDVAGREFAGYFGPSTIGETLAGFYATDLIVHRWDLAASQGIDAELTEEELDVVDAAMDSFGEQAYAPGLFDPPVKVPDGAGRQSVVLARTGRRG